MDPEAFVKSLPSRWADFPHSEIPNDARFADIVEQVPGLTKPNNLALLNHAASCLEAGESYVEVGSFRGTSLIAAMLDNRGDFVAIDDFSMSGGTRTQLEENLARFDLEGATIVEGDAFEVLRSDALRDRRAGVYYYDAAHTYEQQLEGLRLAEPFLAERAVLIVDDTDWDFVAKATRDYLASQPKARLLLELQGKDHSRPDWWEGVQVFAWYA